MPKQFGPVKFQGTSGDITFARTRDGFLMKQRTSLNAARIQTDPAFKRTRENNADFRTAVQGAKLMLDAVKTINARPGDSKLFNRLFVTARRILKTDSVNPRGQKALTDGTLALFSGQEFNINALLVNVLPLPVTANIDRVTGDLEVDVPSFIPDDKFTVPEGTTHYRLFAIGTALDFSAREHQTASAETAYLPVDAQVATSAVTLTCSLPANSTLPLFLGFGINFYQLDSGIYYPLNSGRDSCFKWMQVDA